MIFQLDTPALNGDVQGFLRLSAVSSSKQRGETPSLPLCQAEQGILGAGDALDEGWDEMTAIRLAGVPSTGAAEGKKKNMTDWCQMLNAN